MEEENKNYYAIIPANVRYDRELIPNAKLLYGEVTALCNEKGFCWATNDYFSKLYGVEKETISRWINQLAKKKYIRLQIKYKEKSKEIEHRIIKIINTPIDEKVMTYPQNNQDPIDEKVKDNNTFNNTINNKDIVDKPQNNNKFKNPTLEEVKEYCKERNNNVDAEKWHSYYTSNGWKVGKNSMKDWKAAVRTWEKSDIKPTNKFNNYTQPNTNYDELIKKSRERKTNKFHNFEQTEQNFNEIEKLMQEKRARGFKTK